jgi:hypothetical protein
MLKSIMSQKDQDRVVSEIKGILYPEHCEGDIEVNKVRT